MRRKGMRKIKKNQQGVKKNERISHEHRAGKKTAPERDIPFLILFGYSTTTISWVEYVVIYGGVTKRVDQLTPPTQTHIHRQ